MKKTEKGYRPRRMGAPWPMALAVLVCALSAHSQQRADWQEQIREQVASHQLGAALAIAEQRLAEAPADLEAHGWRARLLTWSGQLAEAESEYRRVLAAAPEDTDILAGLADVLVRQQRFEEALTLLGRARELAPSRPDVLTRRGRVLRLLGRTDEARQDFRVALALDPRNPEVKAALASLAAEPRHEFRVGTEFDFFNFSNHARAQTASLRSQWSSRWITNFAGNFYQRFGEQAGKFMGSATYRLGQRHALTAGGAAGRDQTIIPKGEAFLEYGHGFRGSETGFLRGVETAYQQHWFWYAGARILVLTGNVLLYLPQDWTWSLAVTGARSQFPSAGLEWQPSGLTRLSFPVHRRVTANLFYAVGTESFAQVDQIGRFSARTFGGGARWRFTPRQDLVAYVSYQNRSGGRTQKSFGLNYAYRF